MIQIDLEGYSLNVPIKPRMHIHEFIEIADRLELLIKPKQPIQPIVQEREQEREEMILPPPPTREHREQYVAPPMQQPFPPPPHAKAHEPTRQPAIPDFRFDNEDALRMEHALTQMEKQMNHIKGSQERLDKQEKHIKQILDYLHSLDQHLRK